MSNSVSSRSNRYRNSARDQLLDVASALDSQTTRNNGSPIRHRYDDINDNNNNNNNDNEDNEVRQMSAKKRGMSLWRQASSGY